MNEQNRGVDIIFAIKGCKNSPVLPLREELNSNGFELVYNAKGVGESVLEKEMRKKEEELLKKIKILEMKLENKKSYRRHKKKRRAMEKIRSLRETLEKKVKKGITYEMYLKELKLRQDKQNEMYVKQAQNVLQKGETQVIHVDNIELSHRQLEQELENAIDCMSDGDFNSVDRCSNDSSSMISMSTFGDSDYEHSSQESRIDAEQLEDESTSSSNAILVENKVDDVLSVSTKETAYTESTLSASNVHHRSLKSSPNTSPSTSRFQQVLPTALDNLTKARLLIDKAKLMQLSVSGESTSDASSNMTDDELNIDASLDQTSALKERSFDKLSMNNKNDSRYYLFVSEGCQWSHRVLVTRSLKGLEHVIRFTYVPCFWNPVGMDDQIDRPMVRDTGCWTIAKNTGMSIESKEFFYFQSNYMNEHDDFRVPILWDSASKIIVSRSADEIMRMMNFDFNHVAGRPDLDLYPQEGRIDVDEVDKWIEKELSVGIYRCGQATCQEEYNQSVENVTSVLDKIEIIVKRYGFLCGGSLTAPDVRLFCILMRFDEIYRILFKINTRRVSDMKSLMEYVKDIYKASGVKDVSDLSAIKRRYYSAGSEKSENVIIPRGGMFLKLLEDRENDD